MKQAEAIAKEKMKDLNALTLKKQQKLFVVQQDQWELKLKNNYEKKF